jgi:ATP-dependent RNA helicase RhlE
LPRRRQTLLFSATMPRTIASLAEQYLSDPINVAVTPPATTVELVDQSVVFVSSDRKRDALTRLLQDPGLDRVLVFTRTKHGADRVARHLNGAGIEAIAIHGNKSQPQRERALAGFRAGRTRVLVATDIAARGIDVEGVSHVVNFELPNVPENYVHRIGRTARAGASGIAISLCSDEERAYLRDIEKLTRLPVGQLPLKLDPPQEDRFIRPKLPAESAAPRDFAGPGARRTEGGRNRQAGDRRNGPGAATATHSGLSKAGARFPRRPGNPRSTPSSAAASPARRNARARSGPGLA